MKYTIVSAAVLALVGQASAGFVETPQGDVYLMTSAQRESDYIANADKADDKEVEDEWDPEDDVVDDTGFVHKWVQLGAKINMVSPANDNFLQTPKYSNELANGDSADDRDIAEDEDMNDDVVDYQGQTNAGYGSHNMESMHAHNNIDDVTGAGHFLTDPSFISVDQLNQYDIEVRQDLIQLRNIQRRYSNELANGDSADDRDIAEDEDMKDDVVDYQGQTNAGYGHALPSAYVAHNNINDVTGAGHFLTDPSFTQVRRHHNKRHHNSHY